MLNMHVQQNKGLQVFQNKRDIHHRSVDFVCLFLVGQQAVLGPVSLKGLSFGRKLVRLTDLVPKDTTD